MPNEFQFQETKAALSGSLAASSGAPHRRQFDLSQSGLSSSDVDALHQRLSSTYRVVTGADFKQIYFITDI